MASKRVYSYEHIDPKIEALDDWYDEQRRAISDEDMRLSQTQSAHNREEHDPPFPYVVPEDTTLFQLARQFNVSPAELWKMNVWYFGLHSGFHVKAGTTLNIPSPKKIDLHIPQVELTPANTEKSTGDDPGTLKGIQSNKVMNKVQFRNHSDKVKIEGKQVVPQTQQKEEQQNNSPVEQAPLPQPTPDTQNTEGQQNQDAQTTGNEQSFYDMATADANKTVPQEGAVMPSVTTSEHNAVTTPVAPAFVLPSDRSNISIHRALTPQQKIDFHWTTLVADFTKEFSNSYPKETPGIISAWIRQCLIDGWQYGQPIPSVHNAQEVGEKELGENMVTVISSFSFADAFAYATKKYGEGAPFWWYDEKTGKYTYHTVYYGTEETKWNNANNTYSVDLVNKLYQVSGELELKNAVLADNRISDNFTELVKEAQKVVFLGQPDKITGKLDQVTLDAIDAFVALPQKQQDIERITAHYLEMINDNSQTIADVRTAYNGLPETQANLQETQVIDLTPRMSVSDRVQSQTIGSLGGYNSVSGSSYSQELGRKEDADAAFHNRADQLRQEYFAGLNSMMIQMGVKTDSQLLDTAIEKYSLTDQSQGWVPSLGITVESYQQDLKTGVTQNVQQLKQNTVAADLQAAVNEIPSSDAAVEGQFMAYDVMFMKESAPMLGGQYESLFEQWKKISLDLTTLKQTDIEIPQALKKEMDDFHTQLIAFYHERHPSSILPDPLTDTSVTSYTAQFENDAFILKSLMKGGLDELGQTDWYARDISNQWTSVQNLHEATVYAQTTSYSGNENIDFKPFAVHFVSEEALTKAVSFADPTQGPKASNAPGNVLPAYWAYDPIAKQYVVRVIMNPTADQPYYELKGATIEEALKDLNTHNDFPNGTLDFIDDHGKPGKVSVVDHTPLSTQLGYGALAIFAISILLVPFTGGASLAMNSALGATLLAASSALAIGSSIANMYEQSATGTLTGGMVFVDMVNIVSAFLPVISVGGKALGMTFHEGQLFIQLTRTSMIGAAGVNAISFSADAVEALKAINEMPPGAERTAALNRLIMMAFFIGAATVVTVGTELSAALKEGPPAPKLNPAAGIENEQGALTAGENVAGNSLVNTAENQTSSQTFTGGQNKKALASAMDDGLGGVDINVEIEGQEKPYKLKGTKKDGQWEYTNEDGGPVPEAVTEIISPAALDGMSESAVTRENFNIKGNTPTTAVAGSENPPSEGLLAPYDKLREQLPPIQRKIGNAKYYKFENYLKELPDAVKAKLNDNPDLVEPLSQKFLSDPVWANGLKGVNGNPLLLDDLRVKINGKLYKPEGNGFFTDEAGNYFKKNENTGKLSASTKEEFDAAKPSNIADNSQSPASEGNLIANKTPVKPRVEYVPEYNGKGTGKFATFFNEDGSLFGTLHKSIQGNKLEYTFKWTTKGGSVIPIKGQRVELVDGKFLRFDLTLDKVAGHGVGSAIFDDAVLYFGKGTIKGINAEWNSQNPAYIKGASDNWLEYQQALTQTNDPQVAAFKTWTGRKAAQLGFTKATVEPFEFGVFVYFR